MKVDLFVSGILIALSAGSLSIVYSILILPSFWAAPVFFSGAISSAVAFFMMWANEQSKNDP